jgi:hypothetical protein
MKYKILLGLIALSINAQAMTVLTHYTDSSEGGVSIEQSAM